MDNLKDLNRDHYTFYASFYDAAMLLSKKDRLAYFESICGKRKTYPRLADNLIT